MTAELTTSLTSFWTGVVDAVRENGRQALSRYKARTYHFATVQAGVLYRDGVRDSGQLERSCRRGRIRTIVSLIGDDEIGAPRFAVALERCREIGVRTRQIAIALGGWPTDQQVEQFLEIVRDPANRPVLVHCREGVRRTGMMVSAFRMSVLGCDKEGARRRLETFGHSQRTLSDIRAFIDNYPVDKGGEIHAARKLAGAPA